MVAYVCSFSLCFCFNSTRLEFPAHFFQATALAAAGEYEGRFRSLSFKDEEGRVRDGFDTFVPAKSGGLREGLQKLRAERDRYDRSCVCLAPFTRAREDLGNSVEDVMRRGERGGVVVNDHVVLM